MSVRLCLHPHTMWLLVLVLVSPALLEASALQAVSSHELQVFRSQEFNLGKNKYGSRWAGSFVSAEARSAHDPALSRKCVVMKASDFTPENLQRAERERAAAILVLLPLNRSEVTGEERELFTQAEHSVTHTDFVLPVLVCSEDDQLNFMYDELQQTTKNRVSKNVFSRVFSSLVTSTGFQILLSNNSPIKPLTDTSISVIEGTLIGAGEDPPTIVITAHYDSFGLAPGVSVGGDSGVSLLMELIRLFSKLYENQRTTPRFNLQFVLTGAGKYNFIGTKRWIEENLDHSESSLLQDSVLFVLCLDTLGSGSDLFFHVSRPPPDSSPLHMFYLSLEEVALSLSPSVPLSLVHKKINLLQSFVFWEHERFSLRRIPALSLSRERQSEGRRGSVLDDSSSVDVQILRRNTVIVSEALARFMFNLSHLGSPSDLQLFTGHLSPSLSHLQSVVSALSSVSMATQFHSDPGQSLVLDSLETEFRLRLDRVRRHSFRPDSREPEVIFYDHMKQTLIMYRVKPAAFDLFLGGSIAVYLGLVYSAVQSFGSFFSKSKSKKH